MELGRCTSHSADDILIAEPLSFDSCLEHNPLRVSCAEELHETRRRGGGSSAVQLACELSDDKGLMHSGRRLECRQQVDSHSDTPLKSQRPLYRLITRLHSTHGEPLVCGGGVEPPTRFCASSGKKHLTASVVVSYFASLLQNFRLLAG